MSKKLANTISLTAGDWKRLDMIGPSRGRAVGDMLDVLSGQIVIPITAKLSIGRSYSGYYFLVINDKIKEYQSVEDLMTAVIQKCTPVDSESPGELADHLKKTIDRVERICTILKGVEKRSP